MVSMRINFYWVRKMTYEVTPQSWSCRMTYQVTPESFSGSGIVGDVSIGMQPKHLRRLHQR